jgi:hypothetical protein
MDLLKDIADDLEAKLNPFTAFKIDVLSEEDNALTIRRYTSNQSTKFMDKGRDDVIGIQILSRNTDQQTAINTLEQIKNHLVNLDNKNFITDGSYEFISCDIYIQPILVEKTDRNTYLYQAMFQVKVNV